MTNCPLKLSVVEIETDGACGVRVEWDSAVEEFVAAPAIARAYGLALIGMADALDPIMTAAAGDRDEGQPRSRRRDDCH